MRADRSVRTIAHAKGAGLKRGRRAQGTLVVMSIMGAKPAAGECR